LEDAKEDSSVQNLEGQSQIEEEDDGDDNSVEYEVFFESKKIKETLEKQKVNHFDDLVQYRINISCGKDPFDEQRKTMLPIQYFAPVVKEE